MRRNIISEASSQMTYEIREIVEIALQLQKFGIEITWENIGDPVQKGERLPAWIKEVVIRLASEDRTYGYVATRGLLETRMFLAEQVNRRDGCQITPEDILFFNGLGDAVAKVYGALERTARVIVPSPAYSSHPSAEAAHSGCDPLTYDREPRLRWMPDLDDLERKVRDNESIAAILLINPDNPTGAVLTREYLEKIVAIAQEYNLFLVSDEIYTNIVYNEAKSVHLSEVIGCVPGIAMRGISKEFPWPGSRCGWIEIFNQDKHPEFKKYIQCIVNAKMLEVCSTSLPQHAIPPVMGDPRYPGHLKKRAAMFESRVNDAYDIFSKEDGIFVTRPQGAFYMSILFDEQRLNRNQTLPIRNPQARTFIEAQVDRLQPDKRFAYYLLGSRGICVVPLTGFCCSRKGFRITLLESDDERRIHTWNTLADSIRKYLSSA